MADTKNDFSKGNVVGSPCTDRTLFVPSYHFRSHCLCQFVGHARVNYYLAGE
ncbi:hypothetical protein ABFV83_05335 [Lacrimispora sp. BS-2]|uniref:Uncharacterized protein n=1 Tax=Lacrimispora sp. BS-2 TaxID=3151850 RepID=A0AAU7PVB5_9FIRM